MNIFLLRHGDYKQNTLEESLSERGIKQIESIGHFLSQYGHPIDCIFSSPKTRARETAHILSAAIEFDSQKIIETPFLKPSSSASDVVNLAQTSSMQKTLLFSGHLPSIAETASLFLSGEERPFIRFDTATLCHIRIDAFHPLKSELIGLFHPDSMPEHRNINL